MCTYDVSLKSQKNQALYTNAHVPKTAQNRIEFAGFSAFFDPAGYTHSHERVQCVWYTHHLYSLESIYRDTPAERPWNL